MHSTEEGRAPSHTLVSPGQHCSQVHQSQLTRPNSCFTLLQSHVTDSTARPLLFCNVTCPQRVHRQASWKKDWSPFCTTTLRRLAFKLLLRKANKHSNQKKEPEVINQLINKIVEFISTYVGIWTVCWGHGRVGIRNWNKKQVEFELEGNDQQKWIAVLVVKIRLLISFLPLEIGSVITTPHKTAFAKISTWKVKFSN